MSQNAEAKIDIHCHIASTEYFPASFLNGIVDNIAAALGSAATPARKRKIFELFATKLQDPHCDQLVSEMDEAGIQQAVLLLPDFTFALPDCALTIAEMIDKHHSVLARHPNRFLAFIGVDPRWGSDGVKLFEAAVQRSGFAGLKVYPPCGYTPSDPILYPYYEICATHRIPVLVHIGATSPVLAFEPARPLHIDQAARDFPQVNFILAHGSVHYPDECAMLCSHRPNIYLDVSGYEVSELALLRQLFTRGINHKILFGTDWPLFRLHATQHDCVSLLDAGCESFPPSFNERDRLAFFSGNARRLLGARLDPATRAVLASTD